MKFALCVIAYNEEDYIKATLQSFKDVDYKLVLIGNKPWYGPEFPKDDTEQIASKYADNVVVTEFLTEHEQRNYGLKLLKDYDYVWTIDGDELYDYKQVKNTQEFIKRQLPNFCYCSNINTYWKTIDYEVFPRDDHKAVVITQPKSTFKDFRNIGHDGYVLPENMLTMYHLSYVHSDEKILQKISNFTHRNEIKHNWYEQKWLKWDENTTDLHPYSINKWKKVIKNRLPNNIEQLIT